MSVTVLLRSGDRLTVDAACDWHFLHGTVDLINGDGNAVATFFSADVIGCASNDAPEQAYRDKTGETFGFD